VHLEFLVAAALLQQVMGLTPEQVELLPPTQKAQVLALQQQLVRASACTASSQQDNALAPPPKVLVFYSSRFALQRGQTR
jgi:hypothetical protein